MDLGFVRSITAITKRGSTKNVQCVHLFKEGEGSSLLGLRTLDKIPFL
jgi:hypothetical protein